MEKLQTLTCETCQVPYSVKHILNECHDMDECRKSVFQKIDSTIVEILYDDSIKVKILLSFLSDINFKI